VMLISSFSDLYFEFPVHEVTDNICISVSCNYFIFSMSVTLIMFAMAGLI
jgi:hypothetical protein